MITVELKKKNSNTWVNVAWAQLWKSRCSFIHLMYSLAVLSIEVGIT